MTLFGKKIPKKHVKRDCARPFGLCFKGNGKLQGNETKVVPVKIITHVSHYTALFTCMQVFKERVSSTVQVVGKFWSLHNPQKLHMHQIIYKNYILDFPENYLC